ncbi:signal peptidase II [Myxococcota bacterium]|nr:signal peptidase II [Myxococcota bacterium]MBU1379773.1 signal peptidase II [Myxococcota bacterium]MBU1498515.1 signal peptidase II [Myxococcota bacterium]
MDKKKKLIIFLAIALSSFAVDIGSKLWAQKAVAQKYMNPDSQSSFSINFNLAFNKGSAFSFLSGVSGSRWILTVINFFALGFIYYLYRRKESEDRIFLIGLAFITGGALGNMIDRIIFGHVTDFIQFWGFKSVKMMWPWPTFNVADIVLVIGVGLMLIYSFRADAAEKKDKKKTVKA